MKRAAFCFALCLALYSAGLPQSAPSTSKSCPFTIAGLWRSESVFRTSRLLLDFSPKGHVILLEYSDSRLPQDFEMVDSVNYRLNQSARPESIEFTAFRGNDVFQRGTTLLKIVNSSEDSFTTVDQASREKTIWIREQTHRYFLTLASRTRSDESSGSAFAQLMSFDGRAPKIEALGQQITRDDQGKLALLFGPIQAEEYGRVLEQTEEERNRGEEITALFRIELSPVEFAAINEVFKGFVEQAKVRATPTDPSLQTLDLMSSLIDRLGSCEKTEKLRKIDRTVADQALSQRPASQRPMEYIKMLKSRNGELHVPDSKVPWSWRPMLQL